MRKNQKEIYRIIDENTGLYFADRTWIHDTKSGSQQEHIKQIMREYQYHVKATDYNDAYYYYKFDNIGRFYPTKHGADKMISELTKTRKSDRNTTAKRILYGSHMNFKVVKSLLTVKDVKEDEPQLVLGGLDENK